MAGFLYERKRGVWRGNTVVNQLDENACIFYASFKKQQSKNFSAKLPLL